jgi:hypothetical protein
MGDRAADGMAMGTALSGARYAGGAGGRAPVGTAARDLPEKIAQIVRKTIQETPSDSTHWSTRSLAEQVAVSASSIGRIWRAPRLEAAPGAHVQAEQ